MSATFSPGATFASGVGVTDGDKGDIVVSGSGAAWTVDTAAVTLAKMANLATARFIGRATGGTGVPEALTGTQATALLDNFTTSLPGLAPASGGGTSNFLRADGTWAAPSGGGGVSDGDKGDITVSGGGATWTVDANAITFAKMQAVSANVLLGNDASGTAVEEIACTAAGRALIDDADAAAQRTTLGLATIASSASASDLTAGTVATARLGSGSASGTTFLRGDQTWATPSGGGGWTTIVKPSATVRASTTTLAADPDLVIPLNNGLTTYRFFVFGFVANASADFKFEMKLSSTADLAFAIAKYKWAFIATAAGTDAETVKATSIPMTAQTVLTTAADYFVLEVYGMASMTAAGTNLQFDWAQNTSNATGTQVLEGSWAEYL